MSDVFSFQDALELAAINSLPLQQEDGSFPAGHNGPYLDPELSVRNTAHFLFLIATLFQKTGKSQYLDAGNKAISYLLSSAVRPSGQSFYCRNKVGKDSCNGLIGQAWVIEALVKASQVFDRPDCYAVAEEVFLLHPWNESVALWNRVEVDGTILSFDGTFNHQLWFAAAGSLLNKTPIARERAVKFLEKNAAIVQIYSDGVIFHASPMVGLIHYLKKGVRSFTKAVKSRRKKYRQRDKLYSKSVGYHAFNLYAFAMLYKEFPEIGMWKSKRFKAILSAPEHSNFIQSLTTSEYGYFYNLSGIEIAYAYEVFGRGEKEIVEWLDRQFAHTYENTRNLLTRNASDTNTAQARTYELARFTKDYVLNGEYSI